MVLNVAKLAPIEIAGGVARLFKRLTDLMPEVICYEFTMVNSK